MSNNKYSSVPLVNSNYKFKKYDYIFYFSSKFRLEKFKNNLEDFIDDEISRLSKKYNIEFNNYEIKKKLAICYYQKCEIKGFRVLDVISDSYIKTPFSFR